MAKTLLILVAALAAVVQGLPVQQAEEAAEQAELYRGFKLLSAVPKDAAQVKVVLALDQWLDVDMLSHRAVPGMKTVLMVPPKSLSAVQKVLIENGVAFEISHQDVQESVNVEAEHQRAATVIGRSARTLPDFERYMRYDEIQQYLKKVASTYPKLVTLESAGKSFEGREMSVLRISKNNNKAKRAVFVDAGIHAREWISPPVAIYLIHQLTTQSEGNADLLDDLDWFIMPLVNPDGYEYTHTRERLWRKNRSNKSSRWCPGTDLNRNFGFHYGQAGVSKNPCSEIYAGSGAFSEKESQHLRDYILKANADKRVKMYLTFHSYGPMILYPWGYDANLPDAPDKAELESIANEANTAMIAAGSEAFEVSNSAGLYPAAGASDDWSKGVAGIAKAYTIELPGGGNYGFDMPASRIISVVKSVFQGIRVFAARAKQL